MQGSSFAALCNAALGQVEVRRVSIPNGLLHSSIHLTVIVVVNQVLVALREADADDALLDVLEGRIIKSGIKCTTVSTFAVVHTEAHMFLDSLQSRTLRAV